MDRREFVGTVGKATLGGGAAALGLPRVGLTATAKGATSRPNILFIMTDQQRYDTLGINGNPLAVTPNLDRLGREGCRFPRAYTCCGQCAPARASILTGKYPHNHGVLANVTFNRGLPRYQVPKEATTYAALLASAGYRLGYAGKWHCDNVTQAADFGFDGWGPPGYGDVRGSEQYAKYLRERNLEKPEPVLEYRAITPKPPFDKGVQGPAGGFTPGPPEANPISFVAQRGIELLRRFAEDGVGRSARPFFLGVSFWEPHHPHLPSEPFASRINPSDIPPWGNFEDDLEGRPEGIRLLRDVVFAPASKWTWKNWQKVIARYWGAVSQIDAEVGRLLDALDEAGISDNTLVFFTTDHGDTAGCHGGCFDKGAPMFEEIYHIPLLIRWPTRIPPGAVSDEFVSNLDFMPTFLETAGVKLPDELDGRSLLPLMEGKTAPHWREFIVSEFHGLRYPACQRMVRWQQYKYVANFGNTDELYDLENDPHELHNLAHEPTMRDVLTDMRRKLLVHMQHTKELLGHEWPQLLRR